jgi:glutamine synthetase
MATALKTTGANKRELLDLCKKQEVNFLRLQFTDILGVNKNVEVPESQFEKALEGDIMFDGSSIEGFVRIEESDMVLKPDLDTFRVLPYDDEGGRVVVCGMPAAGLTAADRGGEGAGLRDDGRGRSGVLHLPARRER